ncbi:hypothetical protein ACFFUA_35665 [Streptomyces heliomycini]|uniref:Uncharacterized protein n=1 Tax=Streptomyces heliomycini TaxID=284032 RepID=A0ABV5LKH3_9ACTN|nr:hypothetical protein [Streptomyces sp. XY152]KOV21902.1 hypothetical protein ADK58_29320 [Streptomyces sp. XY152]
MRNQDDSGHEGIVSPADPCFPVFVDSTGRRARVLRRTGYGVAGLAAAYLVVLVLSLMGATPFAPGALLPPLPGETTAPSTPDREGGPDDGPRPPSGVLDPGRSDFGDAGTAVGPGSLLVPPSTSPGGPLLTPGAPLVPGGPAPPAPAGPETPATGVPPAPQEPDAPAPDDPSAPGPGTGTGSEPAPEPPPDDPPAGTDEPPAPEPSPDTPRPTPPPGPSEPPQAPSDAPGGDAPVAGTP